MYEQPPNTQSAGMSDAELAALLADFREAVDMPYALSEPYAAPDLPVQRSREEADNEQRLCRLALEEPDYLAGKMQLHQAIVTVRRREASRYAAALATTTLPYNGVTPGLREINEQKLKDRGGVWAQDF